MKPVLDPEGVELTRRQTCFCGHEYQQTAVEVEGRTDQDALIEKRTVWIPFACPKCSRAKLRASAHGATP